MLHIVNLLEDFWPHDNFPLLVILMRESLQKECRFNCGGRNRKLLPTCQDNCLKGRVRATEQKQGEQSGFWSLMLDSQKLKTPAVREEMFLFSNILIFLMFYKYEEMCIVL